MKFQFSSFVIIFILSALTGLSSIVLAATSAAVMPSTTVSSQALGIKSLPKKGASDANLPESQIPVLLPKSKSFQSNVNPWGRLLLSLLIIAVVGGGMMMFARWYSGKNRKNGDPNKIRILTQFHLGPKKSLAIVRVAGEAILIGVTDHNISMLKSLSLLDGEMPNDFQQTLAQTDAHAPSMPVDEDFALSKIKDRISLKVKDLRPL